MKVSIKYWLAQSSVPSIKNCRTTLSILGEGGHTITAVTMCGRLTRTAAKKEARRCLISSGNWGQLFVNEALA